MLIRSAKFWVSPVYAYLGKLLAALSVSNSGRKSFQIYISLNSGINFRSVVWQMYTEENLTSPPHRDVLLETARIRNSVQLPMPKPTCGLRLPPERFCITAANYRLAASAKKKTVGHRSSGSSFSNQVDIFQSFMVTKLGQPFKKLSYTRHNLQLESPDLSLN
jgi:hypothetical protein